MWPLFGRRKDEEEQRDELLSAYLDGELSEAERQRLEARLSEDAELRAELRAMHRMVSLVRELPQVTAPRNFILSESMIMHRRPAPALRASSEPSRRARAWAAPLLTAATTIVSLLFVVVLAGDLLLPRVGGLASAPEPEPPRIAFEAAPTGEAPRGEADAEEDLDRESPEEPEMAVEEEGVAAEATEAAPAMPGVDVTPPPAGDGGPTPEIAALAAPTETSPVTSVTAVTPTIPAEAPVVSEGELGLVEPAPEELEGTPQLVPEARERNRLELPSLPWSVLEVALGLASLVLTFATIQAWRLRRR